MLTAAFSPNGTSLFVRSLSTLTAYAFDPATGVIRTAAWSTALNLGNGFFGVDQVAVDPTGRRVYATTPGFIVSLDTATGALNGGGVAASPSGIALRRATAGAGARADFDGDRKTDLAIYRPSTGTWWVLRSSSDYTTYSTTQWGIDGDIPVAGDYDGDGKADLAIYRPSTGTWWVLRSSSDYTTSFSTQWGVDGDIPVPGDYDGDRKTDLAIYRPSTGTWWVLRSSSDYTTYFSTQWGVDGDIPVAGDYDGDGKTDLAIYRPSTGTWWVLRSSSDYTTYSTTQWGDRRGYSGGWRLRRRREDRPRRSIGRPLAPGGSCGRAATTRRSSRRSGASTGIFRWLATTTATARPTSPSTGPPPAPGGSCGRAATTRRTSRRSGASTGISRSSATDAGHWRSHATRRVRELYVLPLRGG